MIGRCVCAPPRRNRPLRSWSRSRRRASTRCSKRVTARPTKPRWNSSSRKRPQLVIIEEAYSNLFNTYIDELQRQTGQTWHGTFATHCAPGTWNGSGCSTPWYQGVGIFSTYDITDSGSMLFPFADCWTAARVGVRAQLNVNGTTVQVFGTHLQTGGCADDASARLRRSSGSAARS